MLSVTDQLLIKGCFPCLSLCARVEVPLISMVWDRSSYTHYKGSSYTHGMVWDLYGMGSHSRTLYTHYKDFLLQAGEPFPI